MLSQEGVNLWTANLDLLAKIVEWGGGVLVFLVVWWRTNSFHYLVHRIFQGLGATKTFHSEDAQRHWNEYEDLQQHNLWHGLGLRTSREMKSFLAWLDKNNVSIEEASRAKWCLNANTLELKIPGFWKNLCTVLFFFMVICMSFSLAGTLLNEDNAFIKVKKSGTWFWVNSNEAHNFGPQSKIDSWKLDNASCLFDENPPSALTEWDMHVICQLVLGNEPKFIEDAIHAQKTISYASCALGLILLFWFLRVIVSIIFAKELYKRLQERKGLTQI
jgi:hypothetical protein